MTLRFFRRKPGANRPSNEESEAEKRGPSGTPAEKPEAQNPEPAKATGRRRRGGTSSSGRASSTTKTPPEKKEAGTAKPSSGRSRRGRRGGSSRKAAPAPAEERVATTETTPTAAAGAESGMLEALLTRQETILEHFAESQVATMKGMQGSLSAIENRLAGMSRLATERPRVGIFVDVPNVMYAAERQRVTLDFGKMLELIVRGRELVRASAYAPISDDPKEKLDVQKFVHPFVGLGYRLVIKPLKRYADGSMKANFDVELAIDVLTMSDRLDIVTLVSGDGDFRRLVELVASKGVRVEVVAFGESTAAELRAVADEYMDLNDHLSELRAK